MILLCCIFAYLSFPFCVIHSTMVTKDTQSFWKTWKTIYNKKNGHVASVVEGNSSHEGIANVFKEAFKKNSTPNNASKVDELNTKFQSKYTEFCDSHTHNCDCNEFSFSLEDTVDAVFSMKRGKCADDDEIYAEHFIHAPLILFIKLTSLFNFMINHSFVPNLERSFH